MFEALHAEFLAGAPLAAEDGDLPLPEREPATAEVLELLPAQQRARGRGDPEDQAGGALISNWAAKARL